MWEDLKKLWAQFDIDMLTRPQGPDQFLLGLLVVAIIGALIIVAAKLVFGLLR